MKIACAILGLAALLGGCSTLDVTRVHDSFAGIRSIYDSAPTTSVLVVHGMGQHAPGYSRAMQAGIVKRLDPSLKLLKAMPFALQLNGYPLGVVTRSEFSGDSGKRIVFVELEWSDATRPIKRTLLDLTDEDLERGFLQANRLRLNSAAKQFVNTRLADPLIYSGAFGEVLRGAAASAMCILLRGDAASELPQCDFGQANASAGEVIIISSSMGSSLVFDTVTGLWQGTEAEKAASRVFLQRSKRVYMFANQVPLLELRAAGNVTGPDWLDAYPCAEPAAGTVRAGENGLRNFLLLRRGAGAAEEALPASLALNVVAFSDPNDLLTYGLSDRFKAHCKPARFANVTVTNATTGWLFVAADPLQAHVGYHVNEKVLDMLVHGAAFSE